MKDKLKDYSKYLLDKYSEISVNGGGRVRSDLEQFYNEGRIKDLVNKNESHKIKASMLDLYREKIITFAKDHFKKKNFTLQTFEDFSK